MIFTIGTTLGNLSDSQTVTYSSTGTYSHIFNTIFGSPYNVYIGLILQNTSGSFSANGSDQRIRYTRIG
jgi:hypothetical protein